MDDYPLKSTQPSSDRFVVWAEAEFPGESRLQAAYASVDAIVRAEFLKAFKVRVASLMKDLQTEAGQHIELQTFEKVNADIRGHLKIKHGWAKFKRDGKIVLRVIASAEVAKNRVRSSLKGESDSVATPADSGPVITNENAPGWARRGDSQKSSGHLFICEGLGKNEKDALSSARAICEDKICKLCGVEIESVVQTSETLTGIEMERKVVERCRRVRTEETKLSRRSMDCGPEGCTAWIQVDYPEEKRALECQRLTAENFDDPAACGSAIDEFQSLPGYSAESFRKRVVLIEQAMVNCAKIDVRPTPLMQSLQEKLGIGMSIFRQGAPRYLYAYWLKEDASMWAQYRQSPSFVERLQILRDYLKNKIPLLDVIEAATVDEEVLDTPEAVAHLFEKMKVAPRELAYGTEDVHLFAIDVLNSKVRKGRFHQDIAIISGWMPKAYPAEAVHQWDQVVAFYTLFKSDGMISHEEWEWTKGMGTWKNRCQQELLRHPVHEDDSRDKRFFEALKRVRAENPNEKPLRILKKILPSRCPEFFLGIAEFLPVEIRAELDWTYYKDQIPSIEKWDSEVVRRRYMGQMRKVLSLDKMDKKSCLSLAKHLELLDNHGISTRGLEKTVCGCLTGPMAKESLSITNKSRLYRRALREDFKCILPL